jgi:dihydroorotase
MTCQLTPATPLEQIGQSRERGVFAWKAYSQGVTTNSELGIEDWDCEEMHQRAALAGQVGVPFLLHLQDKTSDPMDGELSALSRATALIERHKETMWCIEHPSRGETIAYVEQMQLVGFQIVCTPTLHHGTKCSDDVQGNPDLKVQPPLQSDPHRDAVLEAIVSGKHIGGWDSAGHPRKLKEELPFEQAPSGIFVPDKVAITFAYQLFKEYGGQRWRYNFARYMGGNAHAFYGRRMPVRNLPPLELVEEDWEVDIKTSPIEIVPFMAGEILHYRIVG